LEFGVDLGMETKPLPLDGKGFDKEVLQSEVPTIADFFADWCRPCQMISPIIESLSREYAGKVRFVKINMDHNRGLAGRYGIMRIPTVMIFKNGKVKAKITGARSASAYKQEIDSVMRS
jgi:thioredoxin 1